MLYDYEPARDDEARITEGDIVSVLEKTDVNWWNIETSAGVTGYVPSSFLEELKAGESDTQSLPASKPDDNGKDRNPFGSTNFGSSNPFGSGNTFSSSKDNSSVPDFDWGDAPADPGPSTTFSAFDLEPKAKVIRKVIAVLFNHIPDSFSKLSPSLVSKRGQVCSGHGISNRKETTRGYF